MWTDPEDEGLRTTRGRRSYKEFLSGGTPVELTLLTTSIDRSELDVFSTDPTGSTWVSGVGKPTETQH